MVYASKILENNRVKKCSKDCSEIIGGNFILKMYIIGKITDPRLLHLFF